MDETDPEKWDTDEDSFSDGVEVHCGSDPLDPQSLPDCSIFKHGFENGGFTGWSFWTA